MTDVTFYAPAMGHSVVPMGISGEGRVEWNATGIVLTGPLHSKTAASLFGCFGFLISFFGAIGLMIALKLNTDHIGGKLALGLALGGTFGFIYLGRRIFPAKETTVRITWADVKKLGFEGQYVTFVSKGKPKGQVWFSPGSTAGLEGVDKAIAAAKGGRAAFEELIQAAKAGGAQMM